MAIDVNITSTVQASQVRDGLAALTGNDRLGIDSLKDVDSTVISRALTGLVISGASILASDTILEAFGKIQSQINGVLGGAIYQGTWNASTNTPTLANGVGTKGYYYTVSVAGSQNLGSGVIDFGVDDWVIYNGTVWQKVDNTDRVTSVFGRIGAVTAQNGDYTTDQVTEGSKLYFTGALAIAAVLTGYTSGAGTVAPTDTILQAIQKLNGNISLKQDTLVSGTNIKTVDSITLLGAGNLVPYIGKEVPIGGHKINAINGSTITTQLLLNDLLRAHAFDTYESSTWDRLIVQASTAGAALSLYKIGIYSDDGNNYPSTKLAETSIIDGTLTTVRITDVTPFQMTKGRYWVVYNCNNTATEPTLRAVPSGGLPSLGALAAMGANNQVNCYSIARVYDGTLPSTFPAGAALVNAVNAPEVLMRRSA